MRRIAVPGLITLAVLLGVPAAASSATVASRGSVSLAAAAAAAKPEHFLAAVSCTSAKSCVAAGTDLTTKRPLAERWNGTAWAAAELKLPAGAAAGGLNAVSCASPGNCVAVGETAASATAAWVPLAETWNGTTWTATRLPAPSGSHGAGLSGVSCPSAAACVVSGIYFLANGRPAGFAEVLSRGTWTVYKPPGLQNTSHYSTLQNVSCMSAASCVAVGSYGIYGSPGGAPAGPAVAEFWNGTKWSESTLPAPAGTHYAWLYDVSCVPSKTCVATGGRYLANNRSSAPLAETWTAGKWRASTPYAAGTDPSLIAVSCVSAASCLAAGGGDITSARNNAFSDSWNGHSWKYVKLPTPSGGGGTNASAVFGLSCLPAADCVAVGAAGPVQSLAYGFSGFWNSKSWRLVAIA